MAAGLRKIGLALLLALSAPAFGASRYPQIAPGQSVSGDFRVSEPGQPADRRCFAIETQRGVRYRMTAKQRGVDGRVFAWGVTQQDDCGQRVTWPKGAVSWGNETRGSEYFLNVEFNAGGGPYVVWIGKADVAFKDYQLWITQIGPAIGPLVPSRKDVADQAALTARMQSYLRASSIPSASTVASNGGNTRRAGETFRDCNFCPEMVVVPAGSFFMGSDAFEENRRSDEGPRHRVTIGRAFAMAKFELTVDEWNVCARDGGCEGGVINAGGRLPVAPDWTQARMYADWLSAKTGQRYFLPSEAEWEYAARAGTDTPWNTGDAIITDDANILDQYKTEVPVGSYPPNAFGLHDMHGNRYEWTLDCFDIGYFGVPANGAAAVSPGCNFRVTRGGGYSDPPARVRSAARYSSPPTTEHQGVRITRAM